MYNFPLTFFAKFKRFTFGSFLNLLPFQTLKAFTVQSFHKLLYPALHGKREKEQQASVGNGTKIIAIAICLHLQ